MQHKVYKSTLLLLAIFCLLTSITSLSEASAQECLTELGEDLTKHRIFIYTTDCPTIGNPKAPITIVAFLDFDSNQSRKMFSIIQEVLKDYPDQIKIVIKHYPSFVRNPESEYAHLAVEAAHKQGKFLEYADKLYNEVFERDLQTLITLAKTLGMDLYEFERHLYTNEARDALDIDRSIIENLKRKSVSQFFVNGTCTPGEYDALKDSINEALEYINPEKTASARPYKKTYRYDRRRLWDNPPILKSPILQHSPQTIDPPIFAFLDLTSAYSKKAFRELEKLVHSEKKRAKIVIKLNPVYPTEDVYLVHGAALAAHKQGKFFKFYNELNKSDEIPDLTELSNIASKIGLDPKKFHAYLEDRDTWLEIIHREKELANTYFIKGSPAVYSQNHILLGARTEEEYKNLWIGSTVMVD